MQIEKEYSVNFCFACCFQTILNDVRSQYCFSSVIIIIHFLLFFIGLIDSCGLQIRKFEIMKLM